MNIQCRLFFSISIHVIYSNGSTQKKKDGAHLVIASDKKKYLVVYFLLWIESLVNIHSLVSPKKFVLTTSNAY